MVRFYQILSSSSDSILEVTFVEVSSNGRVEVENVLKAVKKDTCLITVIMANNETAVVQVEI